MQFIEDISNIALEDLVSLYESVDWTAYTDDIPSLKMALDKSDYIICCVVDNKPVGLARSLSDDVSIHYLQDVLVHPNYQRRQIGRKLVEACLEHFKHVRTHVVLTDDDQTQKIFYKTLGYKNTKNLKNTILNAFVKVDDIELS